jgi:hypothetical protein
MPSLSHAQESLAAKARRAGAHVLKKAKTHVSALARRHSASSPHPSVASPSLTQHLPQEIRLYWLCRAFPSSDTHHDPHDPLHQPHLLAKKYTLDFAQVEKLFQEIEAEVGAWLETTAKQEGFFALKAQVEKEIASLRHKLES